MNDGPENAARDDHAPTQAQLTPSGQSAAEISRTMVQLVRHYTGRGPTKARTTLSANAVLVVLAEVLGPADRRLVEEGQSEVVNRVRRTYWEMMRDAAIAQVKRILDRPVSSAMMDHDLHNDLAALVFLLEPEHHTNEMHPRPEGNGPA